jgi:hypothetical protein
MRSRESRALVWTGLVALVALAACEDRDPLAPKTPTRILESEVSLGKLVATAAKVSWTSTVPSTLEVGRTAQLSAAAYDAAGRVIRGKLITFASSNVAVAKIDGTGLVTAIAPGTVTLSATTDGVKATAQMSVVAPAIKVASVTVTLQKASLVVGDTTRAAAVAMDATGHVLTGLAVTWSIPAANATTASIDSLGKVLATAAGTVPVVATVTGVAGTASLTVTAPATAPAPTAAAIHWTTNISSQLAIGATAQIGAAAYDASGNVMPGKTITYTSSNPEFATLSTTGLLRGIALGIPTISASVDGKTISVQIAVSGTAPTPGKVARVTVNLSRNYLVTGDSTQASASAFDSAGTAVTGLSVSWSVPPTSATLANVDGGGKVHSLAAGSASVVATVSGVTGNAALTIADATTSPPPTSSPPATATGSAASVLAAMGPTIPSSSVPSSIGWYETNFKTNADAQWAAYGPQWDAGNSAAGYDRASIYYVWWARTGDTTYRAKAHATAVNYRINYIDASGCTPSPHWSQIEGLYLDWVVYGDTASKRAVLCMAEKLDIFSLYVSDSTKDWLDNRIQARLLVAQWAAERIEGTGSKWTAKIDANIPKILGGQASDGHWGFISTCWGSWNFMSGMLDDVLIRMYDQRRADPAILTAVTKSANYLWNTQWRTDQSFNYASLDCLGAGGPSSAPDLNGLILPVYGWLGKKTGDTSWYTKGDAIMNGMKVASLYLYKQLSESYTSSYRYLGWRY